MSPRGALAAAAVAATALLGCGPPEVGETTATTRPAAKSTCDETLVALPDGLHLLERRLVPYSQTMLGVETRYADAAGDREVFVMSGGYLDELLEAYDDLDERERMDHGPRLVTVLAGQFLERTVQAAVWYEPEMTTPCAGRGVVAIDLTEPEMRDLVASVRMRVVEPPSAR